MQGTTRDYVRRVKPDRGGAVTNPEISLVLTVYNEEDSLAPLHAKITEAMQHLGRSYEVVYVDDGSVDSSSSVLAGLAAADRRARVVTFPNNRGKAAGLRAGLGAAAGRILVTLDADLQDEPGEIGKLLAKLEEGYDLVIGWKSPRRDPLSKTLPSRVFNLLSSSLWGLPIHDVDSGLKVYRREVVGDLELRGDLYRLLPVMAHAAGFRVAEVAVKHSPRQFSHSKYGAARLFTGPVDLLSALAITRFRDRPAHLGLILGPIASAPAAVLTGLAAFRLSGQRSRSDRAVGSILLGTAVMVWTTQIFVALGVLSEPLISQLRRDSRSELSPGRKDGRATLPDGRVSHKADAPSGERER